MVKKDIEVIAMEIYNDWNDETQELAYMVKEELQNIKVTIDSTLRAFEQLRKKVDYLYDYMRDTGMMK